jgi:hypothetical protein
MTKLFGGLLFLASIAGVLGAVYLGAWAMFIGGIVAIIEQVQNPPVVALEVAFGILRILFAGTVTGLVATGSIFLGILGFGMAVSK